MIRKLSLILLSVILVQSAVVSASPSETSVAHKKEFSEKFEAAINSAAVELVKSINEESIKKLKSFMNHLPETGKHRENVQALMNKMNDYVEKQVKAKENKEKLRLVAEKYYLMTNKLDEIRDTEADNLTEDEFEDIVKKNFHKGSEEPLITMTKSFHTAVQKEWAELYANLDEHSLKDYPEYTTINDMLAKMVKIDDFNEQDTLFHQAEAKYYVFLEIIDPEVGLDD